ATCIEALRADVLAALLVLHVVGHRLPQALDERRRCRVGVGFGKECLVTALVRAHVRQPLLDLRLLRDDLPIPQLLLAKILHLGGILHVRRDEPPVHADEVHQQKHDEQEDDRQETAVLWLESTGGHAFPPARASVPACPAPFPTPPTRAQPACSRRRMMSMTILRPVPRPSRPLPT